MIYLIFNARGEITKRVTGSELVAKNNVGGGGGYLQGEGGPDTHYVGTTGLEPALKLRPDWDMPRAPIFVSVGDTLNLAYPKGAILQCAGGEVTLANGGVHPITFVHDGEYDLSFSGAFPYRDWAGKVVVQ